VAAICINDNIDFIFSNYYYNKKMTILPNDCGDMMTRDLYVRNIKQELLTSTPSENTVSIDSEVVMKTTVSKNASSDTELKYSLYDASNLSHDVLTITPGTIHIDGDLVVSGTTTVETTESVLINDGTIHLASDSSTLAELNGAGIVLGNAAPNTRSIIYNSTSDALTIDAGIIAPKIETTDGGVVLNSSGISVGDSACISFGDGNWRLRYDSVETKIVFENNDGGVWNIRFMID
jgi:archaellum component FlaG (FlaF/FlaG flagellin family)